MLREAIAYTAEPPPFEQDRGLQFQFVDDGRS
jgi:hypothetical protein